MDKYKRREYEFFEFLPGALVEIDLATQSVIYMNRIAFSLFDMDQGVIDAGLQLRDIFLTDTEYERSIKVVESFGLESYQNRVAYTRYEKQDLHDFMLKKLDGTGFYGECQGSFVLNEEQIPVGVRIYIRDLTEQRLMETALEQNEMKYRTLVENSSDLIWQIDEQGTVLSVNSAVANYLGQSTDLIEGKNIYQILEKHTADTFMSYLNQTLLSGKSGSYETTLPNTNKEFWINTSITPVRDAENNITSIMGVSRDITERIRSQERLEQALAEARNANQVKDQFIQNISHEIRTPLTSVTGFTERLKRSLEDRITDEELEYFKLIMTNSERLVRTVDAILSVSQIEAGTLQLSPHTLYLGQLVRLICENLRSRAEEKELALQFHSAVEDDRISLDQNSIFQAILNIIDNAIKYTDSGQIDIKLKEVSGLLTLAIADSGIGISDDYRRSMFQMFSQESQGLSKDYQGIGLGLALTKRYLDLNNVKLQVESTKGVGSIFTLTFPNKTPD